MKKKFSNFPIEFYFSGDKRIIVSCNRFSIEVNEVYFYLKLRRMLDDMYRYVENYSIENEQETYIRGLSICSSSPKAYQHFYQITATIMINNNFPDSIQTYLDRFLFDVRLRKQSISDFAHMYDENLYFYVKIITDVLYSDSDSNDDKSVIKNDIVRYLLMSLRYKNYTRFVILTTHFQSYRDLLKE